MLTLVQVNPNGSREVMEQDAFSINEFCQRHRISRATYYNLQKNGTGPLVVKVGARSIITTEAAKAWRERLESEAATAKATAV